MEEDILIQLINHQMRHASDMPNREKVMDLHNRLRQLYKTYNTFNVDGYTMTMAELNDRWTSVYNGLTKNEQSALVYIGGAEDLVKVYEKSEPSFYPIARRSLTCMKRTFEKTMQHRDLLRDVIPKIEEYLSHDVSRIEYNILELLNNLISIMYTHNYIDLIRIESELIRLETLINGICTVISETENSKVYILYAFTRLFIGTIETYYNNIVNKKSTFETRYDD